MSKRNKYQDYAYLVQLDGDPIKDRRTPDGKWRAALNDRERRILRQRDLVHKLVPMYLDGKGFLELAEEFGQDLQEMTTMMIYGNDQVREEVMSRIISQLLDLSQNRTRAEIAKELGISKNQLDKLISSDEFKSLYADAFTKVRSDPVIEIVQQKVVEDLLPAAYRALQECLTSKDAPWSVRQKAYNDVMKLTGIEVVKPQMSDRSEAAKFLAGFNINVNISKKDVPLIEPPQGYEEALKDILPDIVDGEVTEISDSGVSE